MKRKLFCLGLLCLLLLGCLPLCIGASPLSPALAVLANDLSIDKCGLLGNEVTFFPEDFDAMTASPTDSITVLTLPTAESGTLYLYGEPVQRFTEIARDEICKLTFRASCDKESACRFTFRQQTEAGRYQAVCNLHMLDRLNFAPCIELTDANGVTVGCSAYEGTSTCGYLDAIDPEGDTIRFEVSAYPQKGTLTLTEDQYRYTAFDGAIGEDSFTVIAIDRYGNRSEAVTVPITVLARKSSLDYTDMEDHDAHGAALTLSYCGALSGTVIGGEAVFRPEESITRAEFVAVLTTALGIESQNDEAPVFSDGDSIPSHLIPALAVAVERGWVNADACSAFRPNDPITRADAAELLCSAMELSLTPIPGAERPVQSLLVMVQMGILPLPHDEIAPESPLTRGDAALAICRVLDRM
ncbi:MAG: hypothetical protein E7599_00175 [Ruminococcaceae bacterium]|nr:hypothetical protein [Oscillospiraceae bacterium]